MLPFQTEDFDPGDPELMKRVERGHPLHEGFHLGASGHDVGGERWVIVSTQGFVPNRTQLAYPLPASYGEEIHKAMGLFQTEWGLEAGRLGLVEAALEAQARVMKECAEREAARTAVLPKPKRPKQRPNELEGATPLPGLESWAGSRTRSEI